MSKLSDLLYSLDACEEAVEWAEAYDDPQAAWETCPRADWMLWLLPRDLGGEEARDARLMACDFAERVLHLVPDGEDRPARAIEVARRYALGQATEEELRDACAAAYAAAAASSAYANSADAVASYAADAAAHAFYSADSRAAERAAQAAIIRRYWPTPPSSIMRRVLGEGVTP